jgi:hypothetical protein
MKKDNLPTYEECEEKNKANEASALEIFIIENEPAGIDSSEKFRKELADMLTECEIKASKYAWEAGILSFCQMVGNDMSEEEELGIPIYDSIEDYIKNEIQ